MAKTTGARGEAATAIYVVGALVVVAAFLVWLAMRSEPSVVAMPDPDPDPIALENEPGVPVTAEQFGANPASYVGQTVELQNATAAEALGTQILILNLPQGRYVVQRTGMASAAATPATGSPVTVVGRVLEKVPTVVDSWVSSGVITEQQRAAVQPGTTYIEARQLSSPGG